MLNFLTHASLALELLYPILIWIGVLRPLMVLGMVGLHLGIAIVAPGLTEFGLAMIAANLAFVSGSWLRSLVTGRQQPVLRVIFDGACPRCRASMALLTAADPDHVVDPVDLTAVDVETLHPALTKKACMESMHVISRWGRVTAGFDGVRSLGAWLPVFWPLGLLAWMPGVAWVGRRVYNHLAATRPRDVPCNDQVCGIHPVQKPAQQQEIPSDVRLAPPHQNRSVPRSPRTHEHQQRCPEGRFPRAKTRQRVNRCPRLFVFEPGWRVSIKHGSHREFCYVMAPGQDYYHRLLDGELFVHHGDERLCLSCATRRGLISFEPRLLRNPIDYSLADSSELPVFEPDSDDLY